MKLKHFIAVAAIVGLSACKTSYKATDTGVTTEVVVPETIKQSFITQYPSSTNVVWSKYNPNVIVLNDWELSGWQAMDVDDYVVKYNVDNEDYYAWYDSDGTWVGSAYVVKDYATLPASVNTVLTTQFPSYTISSVNREYQKDKMSYEIVMKKDNAKVVMLIDQDGNIIKQKTKTY